VPNNNGYGYSNHTAQKQQELVYMLNAFIPICKGALSQWRNFDQTLYYIDLNAGPGTSLESCVIGSPIAFLELAQKHNASYQAILIEQELILCQQLQRAVVGYDNVTIYCNDHKYAIQHVIETTTRNRMGLLYADPNGDPRSEFEVIRQLTSLREYDRFDVLIHFSATAIKRAKTEECLYDYLEGVNKKYGFISDPQEQWQWTFILATNWRGMPKLGPNWARIGTPEARERLAYLNNTKTGNSKNKKQKKTMNGHYQMTLPIDPMPNTYVTPVLEK